MEFSMIDLHCHTNCSDGTLSPKDLVKLARKCGIQQLAITDHDVISAYDQLGDIEELYNFDLIHGIEFSAHWGSRGIHILGLNITLNHPVLENAVKNQSKVRRQRALHIGRKLSQLGIQDAYNETLVIANGAPICRSHFARYLVQKGICHSEKKAFNEYLGEDKIDNIQNLWPNISQVVDWIVTCGGIPVLAHPSRYSLSRKQQIYLIETFVNAGGQALEVCCGNQAHGVADDMANLCKRYDLYASVGSDFHTPKFNWMKPGGYPPLPKICRPVWHLWQ